MIDRTKVNHALAKVLAYNLCGNDALAELWARKLIRELECGGILMPRVQTDVFQLTD